MAGTTHVSILSEAMLGRFAERASGYDRDNRFFTEDFAELKQAGYLACAVPRELGGGGLTFAQVMQEQRRLAYHAQATALGINMHLYWTGVAADLWRAGDKSLEWMLTGAVKGEGLQRRYLLNMMHRLEQEPNPGLRAASTVHIRYRIDPGLGLTEDELNARVRRLRPARDARSPSVNPVYAERTGRLTAPLITLHETGDAWVPLSLEQSYRRRTIAAGTDHLLVQRVMRAPSHCGFDGATREQAFDDLVAWIERDVRPAGEDVLAPDLSRIGLKWTPALYPDDPLTPRR